MPYTEKQQGAAKVALHNPAKLRRGNRGMRSMSRPQLGRMASGAHGTRKKRNPGGRRKYGGNPY